MTNNPELNSTAPAKKWRPRILIVALICVGLCVLALDQLTKMIAQNNLTVGRPVPVIGDLVQFSLHFNSGAAFSMGTGLTWLLTLVAITVVIVIIRMSRKLGSMWWSIALGLLVGGATGNLTDRLLRPPGPGRGHVVDFIHLQGFAIFNVADIAISCAAGIIIILAFRGIGIDGMRVASSKKPSKADTARDEAVDGAQPGTSGRTDD